MKSPERRMYHFQLLSPDEQRSAILQLTTSGMSAHTLAAATGLSVEMIRTILGQPAAPEPTQ
jgi:hypothetical protein